MSYQVQLAVYDLSRGMARALSQQLLGMRIDGIWHTGVVVFGKEYYFGGGIQVSNTGFFTQSNGLPPTEMIDMGRTSKSQSELETYLRSVSSQFTQYTYDLLTHNCNNFSDTLCRFLLGRGIPSHIIDLPRIVLSSPGGAMLRPMIEGMQGNIRNQASGGGYGLDPFAHMNNQPSQPQQQSSIQRQPVPATSFESTLADSMTSLASNALQNTAQNRNEEKLILAKLEESPLISNDSSTVTVVGSKILNLAGSDGVKGSALSIEEKETVERILSILTNMQQKNNKPSVSVAAAPGEEKKEEGSTPRHHEFTVNDYTIMERILATYPQCHMSVLFIIRLMFLHDHLTDYNRLTIVHEIIKRLLGSLSSSSSSSSSSSVPAGANTNPFASIPAHVMALCSISNLLAHDTGKAFLFGENTPISTEESGGEGNEGNKSFIGDLIDVSLQGLFNNRSEVRQMSITLAYNLTLACTKENKLSGAWKPKKEGENPEDMNSQALQLFCGCFEGVTEEKVVTSSLSLSLSSLSLSLLSCCF
jgi:hypothetical protein